MTGKNLFKWNKSVQIKVKCFNKFKLQNFEDG